MAFNIANKIRKIEQFDAKKHTIEIVNLNKDFLAELLRTQLEKGLDGNGNEVTIRGYAGYQPFTIDKKRTSGVGLGRVVEWITNYDTGNFYGNIRPHTDGVKLWFDSNVPYFRDIIAQSGGIIMKLNEHNLNLFIKSKLQPELQRRMKNGL